MRGAAKVALAATIGNFLQGWDNATIAGAIVYIKKDLNLQTSVEGLVVAMSLIGATAITTCSGPISDWVGRRPMLIFSSVLYFISGLIMLWSPNVYILCLARLLDGFGIGLAVTLVPVYISETAPPEIRGLLNTLPQFTGSGGMFLSYCMVFAMSLKASPSWRLMLGVLSIPSLLYFAFAVFYLPESPRWLVSKGRMVEAKQVLQRLRGTDDVSGELALLIEGLGTGGEKSMEEYLVTPADDDDFDETHEPTTAGDDGFRLYGLQSGQSLIARPVPGQSSLAIRSRQGSLVSQSIHPLMDPLVPLFGSVHERLPDTGGSMVSTFFPNFGSMFNVPAPEAAPLHVKPWDVESPHHGGPAVDDYELEDGGEDSDDNLRSPLISRQATEADRDMVQHTANAGSTLSMRRHSTLAGNGDGDAAAGSGSMVGIGGGWQLAYKWEEKEGLLRRAYLHEEGIPGSRRGSVVSLPGGQDVHEESGYVSVSALVSHSMLNSKSIVDFRQIGPAASLPSEVAPQGSLWSALTDPGVKRALVVGVGIQILQQFSGINGVLYYTPQILEEAGVSVLLSNFGLSSLSASFLISAFTTFLMLPCIGVAMRLMDLSGRRWLLLATLPVLIGSLVALVVSELVHVSSVVNAAVSTACVIVYFCTFVMGYGPIPNILCSEIFPTRVRGICIAICAMVFWICDIIVTYTLPVLLSSVGLVGIFGIYAAVCVVSWIFVFLKVPETKGMPLEVITDFFAVGARLTDDTSAKDVCE